MTLIRNEAKVLGSWKRSLRILAKACALYNAPVRLACIATEAGT